METKDIFDHKKVEKKWSEKWDKEKIFNPDMSKAQKKFYNLWMFPYPSAEGVHMGTIFSSTGSDVFGRYKRLKGFQLFQPIGFDSFGIHSENYALKIGENPGKTMDRVIPHYLDQFKKIGHGYDWAKTVTTSSPDYYKWTEWLFVQMFKAGLAYRKKSEVNWCPSCKTVLADEQVMTPKAAGKEPKDREGNIIKDGQDLMICERCGTVVERKLLEQWMFRITDYAERLLQGLTDIKWTEKVKIGQANWIGKKVGINIKYQIEAKDNKITVWTSRPDTNYGATFIVVAPEYARDNLIKEVSADYRNKLSEYINISLSKTKEERQKVGKKTGEFTGLFAINQLNGYRMPIWAADFVLADVGTGAVVGVPGHNLRDFEFAKEFNVEIKRVVVGTDNDESEITKAEQVQEEDGKMINSEFLDDLDIHEATQKMMDHLEDKGWGKRTTNYHLRDWIISRQRYWGTPIPMIYCGNCAKAGRGYLASKGEAFRGGNLLHKDQSDWNWQGWWPEENLPVLLPEIEDFKPKGEGSGPLANHPEYYEVKCPECGAKARRETDVSDTFLDSSWYFLRYPSVGYEKKESKNSLEIPWDQKVTRQWLPVDLYFGGAEHTVLHLMYARFVTMALHDLDYLDFDEPFPRFYAHGLMIKDGVKMSKSRGNVVNPDEYIEKYGADTLRLYLMFMGPMDGYPDFRDTGIEGMRRFVDRLWKLFIDHKSIKDLTSEDEKTLTIKMHQTIKKVDEDIQEYKYNTAISAIMEYVNLLRELVSKNQRSKDQRPKTKDQRPIADFFKVLALLLSPFTPFLAEEVWTNMLGEKFSIQNAKWPQYDPILIAEKTTVIAIQVNGKLRGTLELSIDEAKNKDKVIEKVKKEDNISRWLAGKSIKNTIYVPGKLVNFVTS